MTAKPQSQPAVIPKVPVGFRFNPLKGGKVDYVPETDDVAAGEQIAKLNGTELAGAGYAADTCQSRLQVQQSLGKTLKWSVHSDNARNRPESAPGQNLPTNSQPLSL